MTNALINFFEVEMKFPSQEVESEESAVEEVEEERLEKTNFLLTDSLMQWPKAS